MKIELSEIESCVKKLTIEVPQDKVEQEKSVVYAELARSANIPGFRKGKAPKKILEQRYGKSALGDVAQRLIQDSYRQALEEKKLSPVGDPVIEDISFEENAPLSFSATVEVLPEVELKEYQGAVVKKKVAQVADDEVEKTIDQYRERMARLEPVEDRAAENDDFVVMDFRATRDGVEVPPLTGQGKQVHLQPDDMLEAVYSGIRGMKKGEEKTFNAALPKEFPDPDLAGADLEFYVKVNDIKKKVLPEVDDELAREVSEFDTMTAFRESISRTIKRRNESMAENDLRKEVIALLISQNSFDLPPKMVEKRADVLAERTETRFRESGVDMNQGHYNRNDFIERYRESAELEIREEIILASVARTEKVEVSEEDLTREISELSRMLGQPEDVIKTQLSQNDGMMGLYQKVVFDKAYNTVLGKLKIEETEEKS
ncbi:MAG: trigger factor [Nitrospinota bacterium]|nr:trigger factor [Nitrospinota bacterium]